MQALRAEGALALADSAEAWDREGRAYQAARVEATRELTTSLQAASGPSPEGVAAALDRAPDLPLARNTMARLLDLAGKDAAAESLYVSVLPELASPYRYDALLGLAVLARERGDGTGLIRYAEEAAAANPYLPSAHLLLAEEALRRDDPAAARARVARGLAFNPDNRQMAELLQTLPAPGGAVGR
ncbi:MAG: hypothetical protein U0527_17335 [Candidatus Eisenbacteria bacterium]